MNGVTALTVVENKDRLAPTEVAEILQLARTAGDADGAFPLSEHVVLHLRHGGDRPAVHLLVRLDGRLVGYAHVDPTDEVAGAAAELAVHPAYRRRGLGRQLVEAAIAAAETRDPAGRLRLWAHGDHPSASALAMTMGFERWRSLWQMRRSLYADVPSPTMPPGVDLRPFRPGRDEDDWVRVNARAFAGHPEQGKWTRHDLRVRMREPWFDAAGFLLAWHGEDLVGFHWTKVHGGNGEAHGHEPIGEVYVLGVDPAAQGTGLGVALTLAGLRYLRGRDLAQAMLYVDESNTGAVRLYEKLGFVRWSTDVAFRRRTGADPA